MTYSKPITVNRIYGITILLLCLAALAIRYPNSAAAAHELFSNYFLIQQLAAAMLVPLILTAVLMVGWRYAAGGSPPGGLTAVIAGGTLVAIFSISTLTTDVAAIKSLLLHTLLVLVTAGTVLSRPRLQLPGIGITLPLFLYLAAIFISAAAASHPPVAWAKFIDQALLILFTLAAANAYAGNPTARRAVVELLSVGAGIAALYGFLQFAGADPVTWRRALPVIGDSGVAYQPTSFFGNPNYFGLFMLLGILFGTTARATAGSPAARRWFAAIVLLCFGGLLLSWSRAAWLAALVLAAVFAARHPAIFRSRRLLGAAMLILLVFILSYADIITDRVRSFFEFERSFTTRVLLFRSAVALGQARPFFGWGGDTFRLVFDRYVEPQFFYQNPPSRGFISNVHNEYLQQLAEFGIVGLGLFLLVLFSLHRHRAARPEAGRGDAVVSRGLSWALGALLLHALFSPALRHPPFDYLFWLLAGLLLAPALDATPAARAGWAARGSCVIITGLSICFFLQPFWASVFLKAGLVRVRQGAPSAAVYACIDRSLLYSPDNPPAVEQLALHYFRGGHFEASITVLEQLRSLSPVYGNSDLKLAWCYRELGDTETAQVYFSQAQLLEPQRQTLAPE